MTLYLGVPALVWMCGGDVSMCPGVDVYGYMNVCLYQVYLPGCGYGAHIMCVLDADVYVYSGI